MELAGNYRTCNPYARAGTPQSCPDNSACLYTGTDNGFICCRVRLSFFCHTVELTNESDCKKIEKNFQFCL